MKESSLLRRDAPVERNPVRVLANLRARIDRGERWLHIDFPLALTKGTPAPSELLAYVDYELVNRVDDLISRHGGFTALATRYQAFDTSLIDVTRPVHLPVHLPYARGQVAQGENIFMFFPEVLGLSTSRECDYFGLELIDSWECVFDQVVSPCVGRVAAPETAVDYLTAFCSGRKELTYLASVFHELGHRVGMWKVSPRRTEGLTLNKFQVDVLGELSTDTYLSYLLPEIPGLGLFVMYQRLFWFGRMGSDSDPVRGFLNTDNDCWIGAYLWQVCEKVGCVHVDKTGRFVLRHSQINAVFSHIFADLQALAALVGATHDQSETVASWMRERVPIDGDGLFVYPASMRKILEACSSVPTRVRVPYMLAEEVAHVIV